MENRLTIVGAGPGDYRHLTLDAHTVLKNAPVIHTRTLKHPVMEALMEEGHTLVSFDALYDSAQDFERLYGEIADKLLAACLEAPVVYIVPGNPLVGEKTVELLLARAKEEKIPYRIVSGSSCADAVMNALGKDPLEGLAVLDAMALPARIGASRLHLLVYQIDSRLAAAQVKLQLMKEYPDTHPVTLVKGAGIRGLEALIPLQLYQLDQEELFDHLTTLYIPPVEPETLLGDLGELVDIMARLRSPEGCPWDLKQNHRSLLPHLIEEAYEVLDAVEAEDPYLLEEELGDLLLQIVFHAQIASESGEFEISDVVRGICAKLIRRHPHVFADTVAHTPEAVLVNWEAIKKEEKEESGQHDSMSRIPRQLPALMRSYKIQQKAADVGFDWDSIDGALEKVEEEFQELTELLGTEDPVRMEEELGDLLFAVVNVARFLKVSPELALSRASDKFMNRYKYVEEKSVINGINMKECGIEVLDKFWDEAKTVEKSQKDEKRT